MQSEENVQDSHNSNKELKAKRNRKSKNDQEGRDAKCKHCDKTYLSDIALNNHIKTKHAHLIDIPVRGRGRPKKLNDANPSQQELTELKFKTFFDGSRKKHDNENYDFLKAAKENFDNIYTKYKDSLFLTVESVDDFKLFTPQEKSCDYAFWKYLENVHENANRDFFDFSTKFIILFRECINLKKLNKYTEVNSAEVVPDLCNDFVGDFLDKYDMFGMDIKDIIDSIQHCCHWLWANGYTTSRLSLVNN